MGVQNLWLLLAPVGRQIELEALAGQVLAVDASIWLTQFVKAMRDDEGGLIRNAHLLGTFHRVAKLLVYGVRPVFVFDGQTPEIKKRTTARRRQTDGKAAVCVVCVCSAVQQLKKNGGGPVAAAAPGFRLPEEPPSSKNDEMVEAEGDSTVAEAVAIAEMEEKEEDQAVEQEEESETELTVDDIDLDTSRLSKIDLHAVFSLPSHLQKDMIQKILRDRRQEVRDQFIPLAGKPEAYSHTQISAFLATSALNRRIEAAKRQKKDEEMQEQGAVGLGPGHRIDSNSKRFFIYQKSADVQAEEEAEEVVAELERSDRAEQDAVTDTELLEPPRSKRLARIDGSEAMEKRPLSAFVSGMTGLVPDATASAVTASWVARQQVRAKQEPMLAIEKLRRTRLKHEEVPASLAPKAVTDVAQHSVDGVSIVLKPEDVAPQDMAKFQELFPASALETAVDDNEDDGDDDVEWEEVAVPAGAKEVQPSFRSKEGATASISRTDEVLAAVKGSGVEKQLDTKRSGDGADQEEDEMEWEDVQVEEVPLNLELNAEDEEQKEAEVTEDESDELYLTLKNEMEDAKAHEDLNLLKDEALLSAMATASNLTYVRQWAAGAVRRALEAHTQQHGTSSAATASISSTGVYKSTGGGTAELPIELSDEEDKADAPASEEKRDDVVVIDGAKANADTVEADDSDEQLTAALAAAIARDTDTSTRKPNGGPVRYLQYKKVVESQQGGEESVDTAALEREQRELKKLRGRQLRDIDGITDEMVTEVMALLRLFGVPYIVSPMEAEAQCAALEQLGLVDGVITDDSDIFPFGGQRVYKNIFHHQRFVEAFSAQDVEKELGFSREQLIALALLLGSDYTDGVHGIGIVNAAEVAAAYPGLDGLREFKDWVRAFDVVEEAQRAASSGSKKKKNREEEEEEEGEETARERFQRSHASARRKWELGDEFPSKQVVQAYLAPQVDRSEARFSWSAPDLTALRSYCSNAFGWDQQKSDGALLPLMEKAKEAESGGRRVQTRLDRFFTRYDDQVKYAQIRSKRLRSAVNQRVSGTNNSQDKGKKQRKRG
ncbi:hypothetical protein BBJ28_00003276 [Nothophytophthora sp. Chile5]|nr:hypothetical protein BBJ28_00003276 [Nothophytophthora sp. Chile5]